MRILALIAGLVLLAPPLSAQEKLPASKIVRIEVEPKAVELKNMFEYRQVLVTATTEAGERVDVTRLAAVKLPPFLTATPNGLVRPQGDGVGEIEFSLPSWPAVKVPAKSSGFGGRVEVSFNRDVMPVLSRAGCNQGTCHGSADGKNGFKLSLRGYDPLFDIRSLTDDLEGRRVNRAAPDRSLMLMKPVGAVPHIGGVVMDPSEPNYKLVRQWIAEGSKPDPSAAKVTRLEVGPQGPIVPVIGMKQQMRIVAHYADNTSRDVTAEAFVESSNTEVATVDKTGLVTTVRRGEATMLARYEGSYAASTVVVMGDRSGFEWSNPPAFNKIDELVYEKLKRVKVLPSDVCDDMTFLRRAHLDLTGLPPTLDQIKAFEADVRPSRDKREATIDALVGSDPYVEQWANKWADLLQVNRKFLGGEGATALRAYIRDSVKANKPYNTFAYEVLTGSGSNLSSPAAAYYKILRKPDDVMENTTHLFLAVRFNCNKCHDHPFERWTQDQYFQLSSYFAQVTRSEDPMHKGKKIGGSAVEGAVPLVEIIADGKSGEFKHERTGENAKPSFPFVHAEMPQTTDARRTQLAKWVTSKQNPYFAKSYVNRVWSYLTGVGVIEPVDDIRAGNPPTNPALLDYLTTEFVASNFDTQKLIKLICKSRTYQLSLAANKWNADDEANYAKATARRLPAEALYDAIHAVTGSTSRLPGVAPGTRAAQLIDSNVDLPSAFLDLFGKPARESACECERSSTLMLGPILNLINGPLVADALADTNNLLVKLAALHADDRQFVEQMTLATLCRKPTPQELAAGVKILQDGKPEHAVAVAAHQAKVAALKVLEAGVDARQVAWEKAMLAQPAWEPVAVAKATGKDAKTTFTVEKDGSVFVAGPNPSPELYTVEAKTSFKEVTGVRLELLPDDRLPAKGPGRAPNGNLVLNEFKVQVKSKEMPAVANLKLVDAQATHSQGGFEVKGAIDGNNTTGWAIDQGQGKANVAVFRFEKPVRGEDLAFAFQLDQRYVGKDHNIGKFRIALTGNPKPSLGGEALPATLLSALKTPAEQRTPAQKAELTTRHRQTDVNYTTQANKLGAAPAADPRLIGAQDYVWALMNTPGFLFNR